MIKKIISIVKLALVAGQATPAPPIGPALGQHGVNIVKFCKEYNSQTIEKKGLVIPVDISIYEDKSFSLKLKTSPASILIIKAAEINKGSGQPNQKFVGTINNKKLQEIARTKLPDLNTKNVQQAIKIIMGTAKNMGVRIKDE
uniref:Large ribosomal subunit protein uL11m n=1 Tax=Apophlaea sinclairii TaxID=212746 RepID=A0A1C9CBR1_9FLOR|nr:ribosomal protein L11 [Apophlaea sinclairii]AOM65821.1 ribosomal protein L11 [Apophlaea sinclairii]